MKVVGVIPARWASTRFEGKMLALLNGRPMIEHVWRQVKKSRILEDVLIACDDDRILQVAKGFGANAVMTALNHESGTDRIAEAVAKITTDIVVNIQGDEPLIDPHVIDHLAQVLLEDTALSMATVIKRITKEDDFNNPNVVKVVIDRNKNALYFSRSPIPFDRLKKPFQENIYYKHLGLYAYRKDFLLGFKTLPFSKLESAEKLEQLRALDAGYKIKTIETDHETIGVDTPEDLQKVATIMKNNPIANEVSLKKTTGQS
ncbi:MAG: 3-deoxy-manno-octulosonate cytidylyltransferase [Candidatus Omnitrophica bacterium]|nr:3-deoxy-manno-octulosonate cytidylyltransferase [Candidatus Omnitrophota bacterium]